MQNGNNARRLERLHSKAMMLPLRPGVYIMKDAGGKVVYVGKSKAMRNRVSQYFAAGTAHDRKTTRMIASVDDFDFVLADTEMEALALENKLIKLYMPKYNIDLKDGKSYPYIKLSVSDGHPMLTVTSKREPHDRAKYFGPYSGGKRAHDIVDVVRSLFGLPRCRGSFSVSGKIPGRPCIYAKIANCYAPCMGNTSPEDEKKIYSQISDFLTGDIGSVRDELSEQMKFASDNMMFEAAASLRDRIASLDKLWDTQKTVGSPDEIYDIVSLWRGEICSCLSVFPVRSGVLINGDHIMFGADSIADDDAVASAICEFYTLRGSVPKTVLFGFDMNDDDVATIGAYLSTLRQGTKILRPERGKKKQICDMLTDSSRLHAEQWAAESQRDEEILARLASLLSLGVLPERIEAIDVSNLGDEAITAGIVLYVGAKPQKSGYRSYNIRGKDSQDDYFSMSEALERRIGHADSQQLPDIFMLDGGVGHVRTVKALFERLGVTVPVFGMVKDENHRTRTLTDGECEYPIISDQSVFAFIYKLQEEVHRYTVGRMMNRKRKSLVTSRLTEIPGIGSSKAALLLNVLGSVRAVGKADEKTLAAIKGISRADAQRIVSYFSEENGDSR